MAVARAAARRMREQGRDEHYLAKVLLAFDHSQLLPELGFDDDLQTTFSNSPPGGVIEQFVRFLQRQFVRTDDD